MPSATITCQVEPGTDALDRVVCICRRRSLEIGALSNNGDQITVVVTGDDRQMRTVDHWLSSLVNVFDVTRHDHVASVSAMPER